VEEDGEMDVGPLRHGKNQAGVIEGVCVVDVKFDAWIRVLLQFGEVVEEPLTQHGLMLAGRLHLRGGCEGLRSQATRGRAKSGR